jgi:hypothetical protein
MNIRISLFPLKIEKDRSRNYGGGLVLYADG